MTQEVEPDAAGRWQRWVNLATTVIAPATLLSALLFYFGYVWARARYRYFGLDVDTIGLSTRDFVMRSPVALLVPLLALSLLGAAAWSLHLALLRGAATEPGRQRTRRLARVLRLASLVVLAAGVVVLLAFPVLGDWPAFALVTPLLLALGAAGTAYATWLAAVLDRRGPRDGAGPPAAERPGAPGHVAVLLLLAVVAVTGTFWVTATVAQWAGAGSARRDAAHLGSLPVVILDTRERLYLTDPGIVKETLLAPAPGQTYRYRYRNLRLLIQGGSRMFLVPRTWSASDSTVVLPMDASVRLQFQFQNDPP